MQKIPCPACNPNCRRFFTIGDTLRLSSTTRDYWFWLTAMTKNSLVPGPPHVALKKGDPFPRRVTNFHWSLPGAPEAAAVQKTRDDFDSDRSRSKCILRLLYMSIISLFFGNITCFLGTIPCYLKSLGTHRSLEAKSTILGGLQCWISHHYHPFVCL